ncbi:cation diffusion facilitator family transporter [Denitromonas sp.]|uniref:cation diffusion facilitator family transporter n=1 Tax=Denitromonas sp. TaxID=2734609 RepID=UPI002AFFBD00|nr:cation diffusion facilitator family transporter [Denitromonas sp.]
MKKAVVGNMMMTDRSQASPSLQRYAWISIGAAIATILLKGVAWQLTGSVGLLSDAIESFVNLAGALMALLMLWLAEQPADEDHPHGHGKAEYFSSAFEGFLIVLAAIGIGYTAIERFSNPRPIEAVGIGLIVSVVASVINLLVARLLLKAGREHQSITLEADAHHLMTDVWTSVGVILGVGFVAMSGWNWLDPTIALLVAANIVWTGWQLMHRSASGLMDAALPPEKKRLIHEVFDRYVEHGIAYHDLRTRQAGRRSFISFHASVPGQWSVQEAHDWVERIEHDLRTVIPNCHITSHLEPIDDPCSMDDQALDPGRFR